MSQFSSRIDQARASQQRTFILVGFSIGAAAVILTVLWVLSQGVKLDILPQNAGSQAELKVKDGFGFSIGKYVYALGKVVIETSAPGFLTKEVTIDTQNQNHSVEIIMREAPATLHLTTVPEDDNTRWFVDTSQVAVARSLSMQMKAGSYTLTVDNPYYQKVDLEIVVELGKDVQRKVHLPPVQGKLQINTIPSGASILLDGKLQGVAPSDYIVNGGSHTLSVRHPGYKDINDTIFITNVKASISRNYTLLPQDAFVRFQLLPSGGMLLLNGQQVKNTNRVKLDSMRQHTVSYSKAGYFSQSKTFALEPESESEVKFSLREEVGTVEIVSIPEATVLIDGKRAGTTPMTTSLRAIEHEITIAKDGYRSITRKLIPSSDSVKGVEVALVTELQARLAESPTIYKNSAGITMRLFTKPGVVTMGAPRHEKGQRANEFQRKIQLTKAFYAALYETTVSQFSFYKGAASKEKSDTPVTNVSWLEAVGFCNWLSVKEGLHPFYVLKNGRYRGVNSLADGYRLLTEAEWEWLARKAGRTKQTRFVWGDDPAVRTAAGNLADQSTKGKLSRYIPNYTDGFVGLAPVGKFAADKAGLHDLSGNVSEWVHDIYSLVPPLGNNDIEVDPLGPDHGESHVLKGSNWRSASLSELRASFRETATEGRSDLGFRVARYLYGGENAIN